MKIRKQTTPVNLFLMNNLLKMNKGLMTFVLLLVTIFGYSQSASLEQIRNGSGSSTSTPIPQWVNGNAGSSNAHYVEGNSDAYRMICTGLSLGTQHTLIIEWDTKNGGHNAIDYLTHYQNLQPHGQFPHAAEVIDPIVGTGLVNPNVVTSHLPQPTQNIMVLGVPQPSYSFNLFPQSMREMTMFNGSTIDTMYYQNVTPLINSTGISQLVIRFTTNNSTVVFAWGGHLARELDWGINASSSGISGSSYHTRLVSLDGGGGNQDRSLSTAGVLIAPLCSVTGNAFVCNSTQNTYVGPIVASGLTYQWSLSNNTSGATIVGSSTGNSVVVNSGNGGQYTINLTVNEHKGAISTPAVDK